MATTLWIPGTPIAQGSKVAGVSKRGKAYMRESNASKLTPWRKRIAEVARVTFKEMLQGPVMVSLYFAMPRGKTVKRRTPTTVPDIDKLARAVLDALSQGGVYEDDAQVVGLWAQKAYETEAGPGVTIVIEVIDD